MTNKPNQAYQGVIDEIDASILYNRGIIDFYNKEPNHVPPGNAAPRYVSEAQSPVFWLVLAAVALFVGVVGHLSVEAITESAVERVMEGMK